MNCHAGWDVEQQDQEMSHISEETESYEATKPQAPKDA